MFKNILKGAVLYLVILVFVVPVIILLLFANAARKQTKDNVVSTPTGTPIDTSFQQKVPLPSKEDVVRTFCNLIDEAKISEAVSMMDIKDDTTRQSWGVYLNNFSSFKLINIKKSSIDETGNSFEVDIKVTLKENLTDLPIPNYGWENGVNRRWIGVIDSGQGLYKISEIATGP
jgi:hypothetical protein